MKFNLSDLNPPVWFYFDDSEPEEGAVLLRLCTGADLESIQKKTEKKQPPEYKRGNRYERPPEVDERRRSMMLWDYMIVDWQNIEDDKGKEIPCTTDNKVKLMRESVVFAQFIGNCIEKLSEDTTKYQEDAEKNSKSSQKG